MTLMKGHGSRKDHLEKDIDAHFKATILGTPSVGLEASVRRRGRLVWHAAAGAAWTLGNYYTGSLKACGFLSDMCLWFADDRLD